MKKQKELKYHNVIKIIVNQQRLKLKSYVLLDELQWQTVKIKNAFVEYASYHQANTLYIY